MKILVTGSEGFVARGFRRMLHDDVVGVDIKEPTFKGGFKMDCREFFKVCNEQFDLIIHTAAIVGGRLIIENEPLAIGTDLSIDAEMFNWALKTKAKRIVYFSSSAAYPVSLQDKPYKLKESDIKLDDPKLPDVMYGWSKITGELLADAAKKKGLNVYTFRPFSGYGEDQDLDYPFPSFIKRIKDKENPFTIWGDGNQVRDFIHIDDIVNAVFTTMYEDVRKPVNLGTGRPTSFNELARLMGAKNIEHDLSKPVGVQYRCADTTFMNSIYKPKITLEEGIKRCMS